ncbi:MAG: Fe(3+) dicitrate transport protein [Arenicella sp.]|jgi:Fe(3+) dicitrate transport protein
MRFLILTYLFLVSISSVAQCELFGTVVETETKDAIPFATVILKADKPIYVITDEFGRFYLEKIDCQELIIQCKSLGCKEFQTEFSIERDVKNEIFIELEDTMTLSRVIVYGNSDFTKRSLRTIEHMVLTHGKKTQLISMGDLIANKSTNNARELYASVPGLNIWESDGGGLQLGIGARGLSPNRTAHFNTRQNGYDISADALGYPETYYTPPAEAIKDIQMIRGAASLQFGPQFGGMLNFNLIQPSHKNIEYKGNHTYGGYNLVSTFNSLSGTIKKKFSYLTYYKYKQGDGWRDNSEFSQHNFFGQLKYHFTENMFLSAEYTRMSYLAKQAGGLTDALFEQNARQSIRDRNWFGVEWNLFASHFNWSISHNTKIDIKAFKVIANRNALGNLDKITRTDDLLERDLIKGDFNNLGAELRFLQHYPIGKKMKGLLVSGLRYYQGQTTSLQGLASDGYDADFNFINPTDLEGSNYIYPSRNYSAFAENMFRLSKRYWVSLGARYEFIDTKAQGSYREMQFHPLTNELLFDTSYTEDKSNQRHILLAGVGMTYKFDNQMEVYSNFAQNYRGINFSDVRIINPNQQVDENIQDEKGFNSDIGFRGKTKRFQFDVSGFFLYYNNKIGVINHSENGSDFVRLRTNIGNAYSTGLEAFGEYFFKKSDSSQFYSSIFTNASYVHARYGQTLEPAYSEKVVELVPPLSVKVGYQITLKRFSASYLFTYVQKHFTDGTNAEFDPNAVAGIIPSYYVMDLGINYKFSKNIGLNAGCNNFTNNKYFTRRASAYPGPGIIPSEGINFYLTLNLTL